MDDHSRVYSIGALAKAASVSTPTIRYYEQIGLLPRAIRTTGGQRNYDRADFERLTFIRQCRDFGFGIEQVRLLLDLSISADRDCLETRDIAKAHLDEVQAKLDDLRGLECRLKAFVERCDVVCAGGPGRECSIFRDLAASSTGGKTCCCP